MREYSYRQPPFRLYGVPHFYETGRLERVPAQLRGKLIPSMEFLGRRCPGARVEFRTDSKNIEIKLVFETLSADVGMALYTCQSAYVYFGSHTQSRYAGLVNPPSYETRVVEKRFEKSDDMEDVTVWLPRNEILADVIIRVDEDARVEAPTPYAHPKPILYYGSSITEGGCCSKISNGYNSLITRWLDVDSYNFGFSGSARGELEMADYINTIDKSIFVLDYDHNAPSVEHLQQTHEPFFRRIRAQNPELPVVIMTMPDFGAPETARRREIIRTTYQNALDAGDRNVYFVDGGKFFPPELVGQCTNDNVHPNDLGFYFMAKALEPVITGLL